MIHDFPSTVNIPGKDFKPSSECNICASLSTPCAMPQAQAASIHAEITVFFILSIVFVIAYKHQPDGRRRVNYWLSKYKLRPAQVSSYSAKLRKKSLFFLQKGIKSRKKKRCVKICFTLLTNYLGSCKKLTHYNKKHAASPYDKQATITAIAICRLQPCERRHIAR